MKTFFAVLMLASSVIMTARERDMVKVFLFSQFESGSVMIKGNNTPVSAKLNYDMVNGRMMYVEADSTVYLLESKGVILITIGEKSFIPAQNGSFYELINKGDFEYYINHISEIASKGKAAGFGAYSQTASVSGLTTSAQMSGIWNFIGADEQFEGMDQSVLLIKGDKKFQKIVTLNGLVKLFKPHKAAIESFAKDNKTKFSNLEDVISIVEYAYSL